MSHGEIASLLQAAHNIADALGGIASALGTIALVLALYPWFGGFGSSGTRKVDDTITVRIQDR